MLLYVETEVYYVAILHHIVLAFHANLTFFAGSSYTAVGHEVIVVDDFGADKATFKVRVNLAGGLRCRGALGNRPSTAFIGASGQECLQAQEIKGSLNQTVKTAFRFAQVL